ncbi:MAG: hypothetical protein EBZ69_07380 [Alphaproteobacteria bacterium]|nr:hypothetical protein [Alphaproteobacteria bacterium]
MHASVSLDLTTKRLLFYFFRQLFSFGFNIPLMHLLRRQLTPRLKPMEKTTLRLRLIRHIALLISSFANLIKSSINVHNPFVLRAMLLFLDQRALQCLILPLGILASEIDSWVAAF